MDIEPISELGERVMNGNPPRDLIPPSPYDMFRPLRESRQLRYNTFRRWPSEAKVSKDDLVDDGFCYMGVRDKVQCTHCGGVLSGWEENDSVKQEHERFFPSCPLVRERQTDSCEQVYDVHPTSREQTPRKVVDPMSPHYRSEADRLRSFRRWSPQIAQKPVDLAKAGFFYTGEGDHVCCFHCGGKLYNWEPNDEVWEEHAKWFPLCAYLNLVKGDKYVQGIQNKNMEIKENEENEEVLMSEVGNTVTAPVEDEMSEVSTATKEIAESEDTRFKTVYGDFQGPHQLAIVGSCYSGAENKGGAQFCSPSDDDNSARKSVQDMTSENSVKDMTSKNSVKDTTSQSRGEDRMMSPREYNQPNSLGRGEHSGFSNSSQEDVGPLTNDMAKLLQENKSLKEDRLCIVCLDAEKSAMFVPCGHLVCCTTCAVAFDTCPMCRKNIDNIIRSYWS